jgi:fructosamine-3-kinase
MPHGDDISWQVMRQIVRRWAGEASDLAEVTPLSGGCISTAMALTLNSGQKAVLKISPHRVDRAYADEAVQLTLLRSAGVPVPDVYLVQTGTLEEPFSYILMEFIEGVDLAAARSRCNPDQFDKLQTELAEMVLKLHEQTAPRYMRVTSEAGKEFDAWPACYREIYDGIWAEAQKNNALPTKARKTVSRLHQRLDQLLSHDDRPRLVHWDLWATNLLASPNPDGDSWRITALLDPNCKFAHAEAEIAYLELFHTVTPAFLRTYQQSRKLPPEYHRVRKPIYQLYSLLNHLGLFGQEYVKPVCSAIERVGAFV